MKRTVEILKSLGVTVFEQPGCYQAGGTYPVVPLHNIDHHDASSVKSGEWGAHGFCLSERICSTFIPRCLDGVEKVSIIAAGTAPHSGKGSWDDVPANDGNNHMTGTEKANSGSEPYTAAAYRTQVKLHYASWLAANEQRARDKRMYALGHKEYGNRPPAKPGRKSDPSYDMDQMRRDVAAFAPEPSRVVDGLKPAPVPAHFNPHGAIYADWLRLNAGASQGNPSGPEIAHADGGVEQPFERDGHAWWHPDRIPQPHHVAWTFGSIDNRYGALGGAGSPYGYPTSNELSTHDGTGRWQTFEAGICVWHPSIANFGAFFVTGGILAEYLAIGGTGSAVGYPTSEETSPDEGVTYTQPFVHLSPGAEGTPAAGHVGEMVWSAATGARAVYGLFHELWRAGGGLTSRLGLPTSHQATSAPDPRVEYQHFQHGVTVWRRDEGVTFEVLDEILDGWLRFGSWTGQLGMPTGQPGGSPGTPTQTFEHGEITWDEQAGSYDIRIGDEHFELTQRDPDTQTRLAEARAAARDTAEAEAKVSVSATAPMPQDPIPLP